METGGITGNKEAREESLPIIAVGSHAKRNSFGGRRFAEIRQLENDSLRDQERRPRCPVQNGTRQIDAHPQTIGAVVTRPNVINSVQIEVRPTPVGPEAHICTTNVEEHDLPRATRCARLDRGTGIATGMVPDLGDPPDAGPSVGIGLQRETLNESIDSRRIGRPHDGDMPMVEGSSSLELGI